MTRLKRAIPYVCALVFTIVALSLGMLIHERETSLAETSRYNLQWSASQAVIELTRLHSAIASAVSDASAARRDEVRLRYDILMNRMRLLEDGDFRKFTLGHPDLHAIVVSASPTLTRVEHVADGLDNSANAIMALDLLSPLIGQFIGLAATANRYGAEQVVAAQTELTRLHWLFTAMLMALLVAGATQFWLLYRNNTLLQTTFDQLETSTTELRAAHRMAEAASTAKSEFLAKMSHEIRTPMNGIMGMSEILAHSQLDDRQVRLLDTIRMSSDTLLTIINDILDLSRIEAGKIELDHRVFSPRGCVEGVVELISEQASRKGVELTLLIDDTVPHAVCGDAGRLRQICMNLIGNAIKFTERGEIGVRVTRSDAPAGRTRVRFEIRDTGIGIEAETQERLFQPFSQADNSNRRKFGGTGLGLAISRHLVELLGGTIHLTSSPGEGTMVVFELPFANDKTTTGDINSATPLLFAAVRILVVDEHSASRDVCQTYLEAQGARVSRAADAKEALAHLTAAREDGYPFQVVVADHAKAGRGASGLIEWLQASPAHAATPVVAVMPATWRGEIADDGTAMAARVISKPVRRDDLIQAVGHALGQRDGVERLETDAPRRRAQPKPTVSSHILIAEDNPVNIEVARALLEGMHCTCDITTTGGAAVTAWKSGRYDMIFMDCQMPEMDGLEATMAIRAYEHDHGLPRTPILAVTANAFASDRDHCLAAGMDDYLSKPYTEEQLAAKLARLARAAHIDAAHVAPSNDDTTMASCDRNSSTAEAA